MLVLMQSEKGGFMHAYNPSEVKRLESQGWSVVPDEPVKKAPVKKAAAKKAPAKKRARK